jgi:predicted nucleotidyltransferase
LGRSATVKNKKIYTYTHIYGSAFGKRTVVATNKLTEEIQLMTRDEAITCKKRNANVTMFHI